MERPSLYSWLPLRRLLKQGPSTNSSNQGEAAGPYWPKDHGQREQKHCRGHRGRPNPFPITRQVFFHPNYPAFFPPVTTYGARWTALTYGAGTALADHALTWTAAPNIATPSAVGISKNNSNQA